MGACVNATLTRVEARQSLTCGLGENHDIVRYHLLHHDTAVILGERLISFFNFLVPINHCKPGMTTEQLDWTIFV